MVGFYIIDKEKSLKFEIFSNGIALANNVHNQLGKKIKEPLCLRSGLSSGLDIILPNNTWVNASLCQSKNNTPFLIDCEDETYFLKKNNEKLVEIKIPSQPTFYNQCAKDSTPFKNIGSIRADRLSISLNNNCAFLNDEKIRCKFCGIGFNQNEIFKKTSEQIIDTIEFALKDVLLPPKHIYLNSGFLIEDDQGFYGFANIIRDIKENFDIHIHFNPCPPKSKKYIELLYESGLDEISFNLEIFDEKIAEQIIPGKNKILTQNLYFEMLNHAVDIFGKNKVSSCLVVGLESVDSTINGVEYLLAHNVIPKLSSFRPINGSFLSNHRPPSYELITSVYNQAKDLSQKYGVPLGPLCHPCQLHSIV